MSSVRDIWQWITEWNVQITDHMFLEAYFLTANFRTWKHHFRLLDTCCWFTLKGDHAPQFAFELVIFGVVLCDVHVYDHRHEEDDEQ